jgi:hypothetical protein
VLGYLSIVGSCWMMGVVMAFGKGKLLYLIFLGRFPGYVSGFRSGWFLVLLEYSVGLLETLGLCWSRQGFLVQSLAESIHSEGVRFRLELHIRAALYGALRLRNTTTDSFSARRDVLGLGWECCFVKCYVCLVTGWLEMQWVVLYSMDHSFIDKFCCIQQPSHTNVEFAWRTGPPQLWEERILL